MNEVEEFFKKIKDGRCANCEYARVVSGGGWSFLGCYRKPYKGKWVAEIKDCPIGRNTGTEGKTMNRAELIQALKRLKVQTGSLACLGCGREHNCSMHGCAIIRAAVEELEKMQWISVNDRLPDDGQKVITTKNGVVDIQWYEKRRNGWISKGNWFWSMATVTHWMPLPEPMEKKEREKP